MAGPACPACSSPGEGTACQRISSQPSIYFLPVCTLSWFTCEESRSTGVQDVASLFLNFPPPSTLSLSLSFPWVSHTIISFHYVELKPRRSSTHSIFYPHFWLHAFSASPLSNHSFTLFCLPLRLPSILLFSLPTFLSCASPWSRARRALAYRTTSQPASESQPARGRLSVPGAAAEAGPYRPPSSAHLLYLSAGTLPSTHTQFPFIYREILAEGKKKKIMQT